MGGGVRSNPHLASEKILYIAQLYILSALPFESAPLSLMLLRISVVESGWSYASLFMEDQRGTRAYKRFTPLRCIKTRVGTCINRSSATSGAQEFTSCPFSELPPTIKRQLNSLESYQLSENAWKRTVYYGSVLIAIIYCPTVATYKHGSLEME